MSNIVKTEAVVLSKLDYGDTSSIATLFTESEGKISAIIKGGRSPKSKLGKVVDPLNHLLIIIYKKNTREVQILSSADLISHFAKIKNDLNSLRHSLAILELVRNYTLEDDSNSRLFKGLIRILDYMEDAKENPEILYGRFLLFFIAELGYDLSIDKCGICGKQNKPDGTLGFDLEIGFVCSDCLKSHSGLEYIVAELFNYLICLKNNKKVNEFSIDMNNKFNTLINKYLKHHLPDFKEIQSLKIFN